MQAGRGMAGLQAAKVPAQCRQHTVCPVCACCTGPWRPPVPRCLHAAAGGAGVAWRGYLCCWLLPVPCSPAWDWFLQSAPAKQEHAGRSPLFSLSSVQRAGPGYDPVLRQIAHHLASWPVPTASPAAAFPFPQYNELDPSMIQSLGGSSFLLKVPRVSVRTCCGPDLTCGQARCLLPICTPNALTARGLPKAAALNP